MTISREKLLSKTQRRYKEFQFDGDSYRIQSLNEAERAEYEIQLQTTKKYDWEKSRRLFVCKTLVDDNGQRLFSDADQESLKQVDGRIVGVLYNEAQKHCGYDQDEIETIAKNCEKVAG